MESFVRPQQPPTESSGPAIWPLVMEDVERYHAAVEGRPISGTHPLVAFGTPKQDVIPLLVADMRERHEHGLKTYGTPLRAHNGRSHLIDAYQEALDLAVYLRGELVEISPDAAGSHLFIRQVYADALSIAARLRWAIRNKLGR